MQPEGHDDVRVRFWLGGGGSVAGGRGREDGMKKGEVSWQEKMWDPERRLGKLGVGGPILPRSESTALPHFYCLIYAPGDHVGRGLVEICREETHTHTKSNQRICVKQGKTF